MASCVPGRSCVSAAFDSNSRFDIHSTIPQMDGIKCPPLSIQTAGSTVTIGGGGAGVSSVRRFRFKQPVRRNSGFLPGFLYAVSAAFDSNSRFDGKAAKSEDTGRSVRRFRFKQPVRLCNRLALALFVACPPLSIQTAGSTHLTIGRLD